MKMKTLDTKRGMAGAGPLRPGLPLILSLCLGACTNLPVWQVGSANWLGIGGITNSQLGATLTNFNCGISKKILPVRYP